MRNALFLPAMLAFFTFIPFHSRTAGPLTADERNLAVSYMIETRDALVKDLQGLSENQLHYKSSPDRWSVADCVEHIALAETKLFGFIQQGMKAPAEPARRDSIKITDEQLMQMVVDRSHKAQAPEMLKPTGSFKSTKEALDVFVAQRNKIIEYVKTTNDDLRDHFFVHPAFGTIDDYQSLLLITGHSKRHTLQLEEVMADPGFPKQ